MPLYEFECTDCRHNFEELVKSGSQGEGLTCPKCGKTRLRRKMSTFAGHVAASASEMPACPLSGGCCNGACSH